MSAILYAYDSFDVQVCKAFGSDAKKLNCYRNLKDEGCEDLDSEEELACHEKIALSALKETKRGFTLGQICKAAIAVVMRRDVSIIREGETIGNYALVEYIRPSDHSRWTNKCKIQGSKVIWATAAGRWRYEDNIQYRINEKTNSLKITEIYQDGSSYSREFTIDQLSGVF